MREVDEKLSIKELGPDCISDFHTHTLNEVCHSVVGTTLRTACTLLLRPYLIDFCYSRALPGQKFWAYASSFTLSLLIRGTFSLESAINPLLLLQAILDFFYLPP